MPPPDPTPPPRAHRAPIAAGALTVVLYGVPFLRVLALPLLWLSTLVHEMGHGVVAVLVGGHFTSFQMWWDGSGIAHTDGVGRGGPEALVAAGGLLGPAAVAL